MAITQILVLFAFALLLSMLFAGVDSTRSNETWHEHAVERSVALSLIRGREGGEEEGESGLR